MLTCPLCSLCWIESNSSITRPWISACRCDHRKGRLTNSTDSTRVWRRNHDWWSLARIQWPHHHHHGIARADPERTIFAPDEVSLQKFYWLAVIQFNERCIISVWSSILTSTERLSVCDMALGFFLLIMDSYTRCRALFSECWMLKFMHLVLSRVRCQHQSCYPTFQDEIIVKWYPLVV